MTFKKGEKYSHTIKGRGWDSKNMVAVDEIREIEIIKVFKRNGKTFVKFNCSLGFGGGFVVEEIQDNAKHIFKKIN